jgi:succinate dehydrogenase hydrophobic anchor subunit
MRFRDRFLIGGSLIVLIALFATDPDKGLSTGMQVLSIASGMLALILAHWALKALFDYKSADREDLFTKAKESATGAGLALISLAIVFHALIGLFSNRG